MSIQIKKIGVIGGGKVAHKLGEALKAAGVDIVGTWNRSEEKGVRLASKLDAQFCTSVDELLLLPVDLIIIAVSDRAIAEVATLLNTDIPVCHTSGTFNQSENKDIDGVFYPLQSFTKNREVDFKQIPILIEAKDSELSEALMELGMRISTKVQLCTQQERERLHVAAVWVNNYVNHMIQFGQRFCTRYNLNFELLVPLLHETVSKAIAIGAKEAQTGPALRGDMDTVKKHASLMEKEEALLYQLIALNIQDLYKDGKL